MLGILESQTCAMNLILEFFPGLREMDNLHPLIVHFPIALLSCFLLLDGIAFLFNSRRLSQVASWFLWLGTVGALAAVAAGIQASLTVAHPDAVHSLLERHRNFGLNTASLAVVLSVWRLVSRGGFSRLGHFVHLLIALLMMINLLRGADLGGLMVYKYGVAVEAAGIRASGHAHGDMRGELQGWLHDLLHGQHEHGHTHEHDHHVHEHRY